MEDIYCYDKIATRKAEKEYDKRNEWVVRLNVGGHNTYIKADSYWMSVSKMRMEIINEEDYNRLADDWQVESWVIYWVRN